MERTGLRGHTLFQMLQPRQVERISNATEHLTLEAGASVYRAGDPATSLFVVREGQVALHSVSGGITLHVDNVLPGEIFGTCLCFDRANYALEAVCIQKSTLLRIPTEALQRILNDDLVLGFAVQKYISGVYFRRYIEAVTRLESLVKVLPLANG